jgi:polysaccharide export outer membrane protein
MDTGSTGASINRSPSRVSAWYDPVTALPLRRAFFIAVAAAIPGCSPVPSMPPAPPAPPPDAGMMSELTPYRIQVGDILDIKFILNPELNEEVTVRPDGHVSTTVVHDAVAYGRTVPELIGDLTGDYAHELKNPRLSVVVKSFAPTKFYVGGEVTNPGEFVNVGPNLTLTEAIARAGGLKMMTGDEDKIFIIRRAAGNVPQFFSVRYQDLMWGKNAASDVQLAPYDVVYVPRAGVAEVYKFVNQYLLQFVPVSWGFSYVTGGATSNVTPIK